MSRVLPASCINYSVTCEGVEIEDAVILSEGKGASEGILILQNGVSYYVASSMPDIKSTIANLSDTIQQIVNGLEAIASSMSGSTTAPPPALAGIVGNIYTLKAQLDQLEGDLI